MKVNMSYADYDMFLEVLDSMETDIPEYPSEKDLDDFLEDADKFDIKYLAWLEDNLPDPQDATQEQIRKRIRNYLKKNLIIDGKDHKK